MMKRTLQQCVLSFIVTLGRCAFGGGYPVRPATQPMMDRYIEVMRQPESREKRAQIDALELEFAQAVEKDPHRAGQAVGIITDDRGIPLQGVTVTAERNKVRTRRDPQPRPEIETTVVDRESNISMKGFPKLGLRFQKTGYAEAGFGFGADRGSLVSDPDGVGDRLDSVSYVVPRSDGGPGVHVVMRPAKYEWIPESDNDRFTPDKKFWPKTAPADAPALVTSDAPRFVAVPETGTYVATDSSGKVLDLVRLHRGMRLGFNAGSPSAAYRGSGARFSVVEGPQGPYAWRLYAVAKPIYPTSQPSTTGGAEGGRNYLAPLIFVAHPTAAQSADLSTTRNSDSGYRVTEVAARSNGMSGAAVKSGCCE